MRSHLPTTKQLRYFVALEKHRHFGRAAKACFVSQPAFSSAIRELESLLDVQLVDRTNRSVTITLTGQEVAVQARLVLRDLEALVETTDQQQDPFAGDLTLGVIPTIAPFVLPRLLPKLRKLHPKLRLFLREDMSAILYEQLLQGKLDVILLALPYELPKAEVLPLFRDEFVLAHSKQSKLGKQKSFSVDALSTHSVLLLEDGHCLRDQTLAACRIRNLQKISTFSASSLLTLVHMVAADLGVTYLPKMALDAGLLNGTQVKTKNLSKRMYREIALAWRKGSARDAEFAGLGALITECSHR